MSPLNWNTEPNTPALLLPSAEWKQFCCPCIVKKMGQFEDNSHVNTSLHFSPPSCLNIKHCTNIPPCSSYWFLTDLGNAKILQNKSMKCFQISGNIFSLLALKFFGQKFRPGFLVILFSFCILQCRGSLFLPQCIFPCCHSFHR